VVQGHLGKKLVRLCLKEQAGCGGAGPHSCNAGAEGGDSQSQACPRQKPEILSEKLLNQIRARSVA
jgi:hypothetical protein